MFLNASMLKGIITVSQQYLGRTFSDGSEHGRKHYMDSRKQSTHRITHFYSLISSKSTNKSMNPRKKRMRSSLHHLNSLHQAPSPITALGARVLVHKLWEDPLKT